MVIILNHGFVPSEALLTSFKNFQIQYKSYNTGYVSYIYVLPQRENKTLEAWLSYFQKEHFSEIKEVLWNEKTPAIVSKIDKEKRIRVGDIEIGGQQKCIIAGPCCIESYDQMEQIALSLSTSGINFLRGGAYKPSTSPYSFHGLGEEGLKILQSVALKYRLKTVTEVLDPRDVEKVASYADILQIGTRNMQNFSLLHEVGQSKCPVILKRGMSATYEEWLLAAEHIAAYGNENIILCERGIRTFESGTRNTLDLLAIPYMKKRVSLPIIIDPSHAAGVSEYIPAMARAAIAAGADGLMIETHHDPASSYKDSKQALSLNEFNRLMHDLNTMNLSAFFM